MANQDLQHMPNSPWPTMGKPESAAGKAEGTAGKPEGTAGKADAAGSFSQRTEKAAEQAAGSAIEQVRSVTSGLTQQRGQVAERIRRVSDLMRDSGERVRKDDEMAAEYFHMASERIDRVASYVGSADLASFAADTQEFVRRRPAVFFGGAFLLGLAAGRFLKASSGSGSYSHGTSGPKLRSRSYGEGGSPQSTGRESKRLPSEGTPDGAQVGSATRYSTSTPNSRSGATSPAATSPGTANTYSPASGQPPRQSAQQNPTGGNGNPGNPGNPVNQGSSRLP